MSVEPVAALAVPVPQLVQAAPAPPYLPVAQFAQSVDASTPVLPSASLPSVVGSVVLPASQEMHTELSVAEVAAEYVPARHAVQAPPAVAYVPAAQPEHDVPFADPDPATLVCPASQARHVLMLCCPLAVEYLPATQSMQAAADTALVLALHLPATHALHPAELALPVLSL